MLTEVYDYSNSYVTFVTLRRENTARIAIEASCRLVHGKGSEEFFLIASCKGETVYVDGELFRKPSYDWFGVFSQRDYRLFRTFATYENDREDEFTTGRVKDNFHEVRTSLSRTPDATVLSQEKDIVDATLQNRRLVGRTTVKDEASNVTATIEYPIKTINVNPDREVFQVDTGPVLYPDLGSQNPRIVEWLRPAYLAYNSFEYAEFIVQSPTPVGQGLWVKHYSEVRGMKVNNSVYCVPSL